jgi:hypothetical protein
MYSLSEKLRCELSLIASINNFFKTFKIGSALKNSNAYKKRGIPVKDIVMYLISLAYMGKTMHRDVCSKEPVVRKSDHYVREMLFAKRKLHIYMHFSLNQFIMHFIFTLMF